MDTVECCPWVQFRTCREKCLKGGSIFGEAEPVSENFLRFEVIDVFTVKPSKEFRLSHVFHDYLDQVWDTDNQFLLKSQYN